MKDAVLRTIARWQANPHRPTGWCKFEPTCSAYGYSVIEEFGLVRGGLRAVLRISRCSACSRGGFDPPPHKEMSGA